MELTNSQMGQCILAIGSMVVEMVRAGAFTLMEAYTEESFLKTKGMEMELK